MNERGCGMGGKVRVLVRNDEHWVGESHSSENPSVPSYNKLIRLRQRDHPIVCERLSQVKLRPGWIRDTFWAVSIVISFFYCNLT